MQLPTLKDEARNEMMCEYTILSCFQNDRKLCLTSLREPDCYSNAPRHIIIALGFIGNRAKPHDALMERQKHIQQAGCPVLTGLWSYVTVQ